MVEQDLLAILLSEFHEKLQRFTPIQRDIAFPEVKNKIKVAIGMRRAGKTSFLLQTIQSLLVKQVPISQILYINFEDDRLIPLTREKCAKLIEAFYALYPENHDRHCYFFLDEIQMAPDWAIIVRRFYDTKNIDMYLSGSSAKLLSKEIHTSLRGRSLSTEVWPLSFKEFLKENKENSQTDLLSQKTQDRVKKYFERYLICGGFPEVINFDADIRIQTLQEYIDVVIYRDIIERHGISNTALLKYLILFLIQNSGASFSINKFYNDVKSQGYQINKNTLYDYMHYIEDAYLAFSVGLYNRSVRKVQTNPKKIYAVDPGLINAVTLNKQYDLGKLFETIVYLDLRRQGCHVNYYLTKERFEVDFLAQTPDGKQKLIQVCWDASDKNTLARETRALEAAQKELKIEGEIITLQDYLKRGVR